MGLHEHDTQLPSLETETILSYKPTLPKHLIPGGSVSYLFFAILPPASLALPKTHIIFCWRGVEEEMKHNITRIETLP